MIYDFKAKTGIITPPKCGTTILHDILCKFPQYWYICGPAMWDTTTKHCSAKMIKTHEVTIDHWVLMIRHPISRMISMWKHRKTYDGIEETLIEFVQNNNLSAGWYAPCASFVDNPKGVIRQEHLYEDCIKILSRDLPELNTRTMNISSIKFTPTEEEERVLVDAATNIYHEDLKLGNYEVLAYRT